MLLEGVLWNGEAGHVLVRNLNVSLPPSLCVTGHGRGAQD